MVGSRHHRRHGLGANVQRQVPSARQRVVGEYALPATASAMRKQDMDPCIPHYCCSISHIRCCAIYTGHLLDGIWISTSDPGWFVSQWQLLLSALTFTIWANTAALLLSGPPKRIHQRMILALGASILALRSIAIVISAYVSGLALLIELPLVLIDTMYAIPIVATWKAYTPVGQRLFASVLYYHYAAFF